MNTNTTETESTLHQPSHKTASRDEWIVARRQLLEAEKDLTKRSDAIAQQRQELPWVRVEKEYQFETERGSVSLKDLFQGRSQLIVYHFMFGPDYKAGCPSCSSIADGFDGITVHLANHDVILAAISRAPFAKLREYKNRMGWKFPWASSFESDFNMDFSVSFSEQQQNTGDIEYNYERGGHAMDKTSFPAPVVQFANTCGTDAATYTRDRPGMSAFVMDDGVIYHTYSAYSRGVDGIWSMYEWLDRAPKGRNETGPWWRRHDEYESEPKDAGSSCCCH